MGRVVKNVGNRQEDLRSTRKAFRKKYIAFFCHNRIFVDDEAIVKCEGAGVWTGEVF